MQKVSDSISYFCPTFELQLVQQYSIQASWRQLISHASIIVLCYYASMSLLVKVALIASCRATLQRETGVLACMKHRISSITIWYFTISMSLSALPRMEVKRFCVNIRIPKELFFCTHQQCRRSIAKVYTSYDTKLKCY